MCEKMRFKVWYKNDEVTLTVYEGQDLTVQEGGPTDEGWYRVYDRYYLEDGVLHCEHDRSERDCDGRLDTGGIYRAETFNLERFPMWESVESHQRDYEAEKAGY